MIFHYKPSILEYPHFRKPFPCFSLFLWAIKRLIIRCWACLDGSCRQFTAKRLYYLNLCKDTTPIHISPVNISIIAIKYACLSHLRKYTCLFLNQSTSLSLWNLRRVLSEWTPCRYADLIFSKTLQVVHEGSICMFHPWCTDLGVENYVGMNENGCGIPQNGSTWQF